MAGVRNGSGATRLTTIGLILIIAGVIVGATTIAQYSAANVALAIAVVLWVLSAAAVVVGIVMVVRARPRREAVETPRAGEPRTTQLPRGGDPLSRTTLDDVDPEKPDTRDPHHPRAKPD